MAAEGRSRFAFLYQSEAGAVDARMWLRAALPLVAIFLVLTLAWLFVRPYVTRDISERKFFDAMSLAASIFGLLYALAVMLLGICWVNLSAKRFRDRGRAPAVGLAGLLPLAVLLDGALRWLQPRIADTLPGWSVFLGDAVVAAVLIWTVVECLDVLRGTQPPVV